MMERITGNVDLGGIKRFQVPDAIVKVKCPICGYEANIPLVDQIYYPEDGGHYVKFDCEKCDHEVMRKIKIVSVIATFDVAEPEII